MPLSLRFPTALARLLTSAQPLHPDAARYAFDETAAHPLNNRTKSVEGSNDRLGLNHTLLVGNRLTCTDKSIFAAKRPVKTYLAKMRFYKTMLPKPPVLHRNFAYIAKQIGRFCRAIPAELFHRFSFIIF
ncbi:hypothetical protein EII32_02190 [Prevotella sp. OH937_COT-195]|nr:hypothetical protein EII32_02190 [Prevotella sp. OH937_COT-195]